jgi:hypothetical protein
MLRAPCIRALEAVLTKGDNTMAKQFKKGDEVWSIVQWDRLFSKVMVKKLTIQSWGKKVGTASHASNGTMTKHQIYIGQDEHLFLTSGVADIGAFALEVAKKYKADRLAYLQDFCLGQYLNGGYDDTTPHRVRYLDNLKQEIEQIIDSEIIVLFSDK